MGLSPVPKVWRGTVTHRRNRLYYIHSGEGWYIEREKRIYFRPGLIYFIPYMANVSTFAPVENRLIHTYANIELIPPIISRNVLFFDPHQDPVTEATLCVFNTLCKKQTDTKKLSESELKLLKRAAFFLSSVAAEKSGAPALDDKLLIHALEIMHTHIGDGILISDVAKMCYMSTDGFIRRFSKKLGETPYSYLKKLKIATAEELRESGATLAEAAEKCGYANASTLLHAAQNHKP